MYTSLEYGHWGITVSQRDCKTDYAPFTTKTFSYPVSTRGPINSAETERFAIAYAKSIDPNAEIKGPFFK